MKKMWLFTVAIVAIGVIMRAAFTTMPIFLADVARSFDLPLSQLGILTSIPLLMFALVSPFVVPIAHRVGLERLLTIALGITVIGSFIRVANFPFLLLGTALVGVGIAVLNVLIPPTLLKYVPAKIGFFTALYTTLFSMMSAGFQVVSSKVAQIWNWQMAISLVSLFVLAAFVAWVLNTGVNQIPSSNAVSHTGEAVRPNPWKNKYAWLSMVIFGAQSAVFYSVMTWLPLILKNNGFDTASASLITSFMSLFGIPATILLPGFFVRASSALRRRAALLAVLLLVIGISLIVVAGQHFWLYTLGTMLQGFANASLFLYVVVSYGVRTTHQDESAAVSGMSQAGGYVLTAIAPWLFGVIYGQTHGWSVQFGLLYSIMLAMFVAILLFENDETFF